jgi:endonuclease/exonuclease/phosphatase family metal-dependent hydrolase
MKIISWNILANEFIKKSYYPMISEEDLFDRENRKKQILTILTNIDSDIMLLQEVMQSEYNIIVDLFKKTHYTIRGKNIKWQKKQHYSGNVILLRKTQFKLPHKIITLDFGVGVICSYHNQYLLILNVHLDDVSHDTRMKQISELIPYLHTNSKIVMGGDFNENYKSSAPSELYNLIKKSGLHINNKKPTYYIEGQMCIDNIMTKGIDLNHTVAHVLNYFGKNKQKQYISYGSDHLPVVLN